MAYRKSAKYIKQLANMRAAKAAKREAGPALDYPASLPDLRRVIEIRDYDFGEKIHRIEMYKTNRRDCYRVVADGVEWKDSIGWSRILAGLRMAMPRVGAA